MYVGFEFRPSDDQAQTERDLQGRHARGRGSEHAIHIAGRLESLRPLDLQQLAARLRPFGEVRANEFALKISLPEYELTFFPDGRAIVKGTTDVALARSLYARLVGA